MNTTGHQNPERLCEAQFPDFKLDVTIPSDWSDTSYHNDVCPSYRKSFPSGRSLRIWVDFADPARREYPNSPRFTVQSMNADEEFMDDIVQTDDWEEVLKATENFLD